MSDRVTQQQLESYLWGAATLLRGLIDAGDYKQFIFPLLFFKRISDVWDEEYARALDESGGDLEYASFAENHRFQIPEGAHWRDVRAVTRSRVRPTLHAAALGCARSHRARPRRTRHQLSSTVARRMARSRLRPLTSR